MKKAQLSGSLRTNVGKKDAAAQRVAGMVPCVIYGSGEQTHFSVKSVDVQKIIFSVDIFQVEIDIDGTKKIAIIQDLQMHPVKDIPMHIDFLELDDARPVKVSLPLRTEGSPIGVMNGGKLRQPYRKLRMIGLPGALPEAVTIDVTDLKIGSSIRVSELEIEGVEVLEPASAVVVSVKMARGASEDEEEEETEGEEGEEGEAAEESKEG
ncbi:MAG: 50S ribosomal protein L25 [Crocinitomicaceae bacterium]|nr:50S ribosomal protein L25 [Crocinitomicaceae bacterium]